MIALSTAYLLAAAASAALPGYTPAPATAAPNDAFPPVERLLGEARDPLDALVSDGEDLRDSVASPRPGGLADALRAHDAAVRQEAIEAAGVPRNAAAIPHLRGVLLRLDERPAARAAAAVALGRIGDALAAPALAEALRDPAEEVRYAAAHALGRAGADGSATRLAKTLASDPSWWVRHAAAASLGRLRRPFSAAALEDCLKNERRWQVRLQAVRSLQELGGPSSARALEIALLDPDSGVRAAAALSLGEIGGGAQLPPLRAALRLESDASTRAIMAGSFRRLLARR